MRVRAAGSGDRDTLHELGRAMIDETQPHLAYDAGRADDTFDRYLNDRNPVFFVVEDDGEPVGFLIALQVPYFAAAGFFVGQNVFYVRPDKRGTRAAASLFKAYVQWAERIGPEEMFAGIGRGERAGAKARWMRRFGFEPSGQTIFRRIRKPSS